MKKFITLALFVAGTACFAQHSITLKLSDLKSDTAVVMLIDKSMSAIEKLDTLIAKNGTFTYDFKGDKARLAQVRVYGDNGPGGFTFFLVPGEQGTITGTTKHAEWSGTKFYTDLANLEKITDPLETEMQNIDKDFQTKVQAGANVDSLRQALIAVYEAKSEEIANVRMEYIKANPGKELSVTLLNNVKDQASAMALLTPEVKAGKFSAIVAAIQTRIDEQKSKEEAAKKVAPGCMAPNFTLKTPEGTDLSLNQLRGKYLILDFWGSWCGWCIKGFPEMKNYYKKYSGKFEILGVDCNDSEEKWKEAIKKNELPWKHVYNTRNSTVTTDYAIEGYPTKIVIDPDGKIVKTIVGEDPKFYEFLDELFK